MKPIVLAFLATLVGCELSFAASLTGATFFTAGPLGNTTLETWNTLGSDIIFNLYLLNGVTPLNSGNGSNARINVPLNLPGTYTFTYRAQPLLQNPGQFGLNLFFDGVDNTPGISGLDGLPLAAGANTLLYVNGDRRITVTALSQSRSGGNQVGPFTNTPGLIGGNDYVGSFSSFVETPEPSTYLLFGAGFAAIAAFRRRR
ncbi:MAG: PEP-CTERM sorting domain-containing protein [Acidobacteria bacterium]|nr:PEP-CTERM sorting domain-containing protein [Acidobacteriota bacterium]